MADFNLGSIYSQLTLDQTPFQRALIQVQQSIAQVTSQLQTLQQTATTTFQAMAKSAQQSATAMTKSLQTGLQSAQVKPGQMSLFDTKAFGDQGKATARRTAEEMSLEFRTRLGSPSSAASQGFVASLPKQLPLFTRPGTAPPAPPAEVAGPGMLSTLGGLALGYLGVATAIGAVALAMRGITASVGITTQLEGMRVGFVAITGSALGAQDSLAFVRAEASRLGLDFVALADGYKGVAAAARGTTLEGEPARQIFIAIAEAARIFNLSGDATQRSLVAIQQMISKGKVSSEELRQQLGEHLPGAFQIASRAMGVTVEQLSKMLEQGQILSTDFLPKFAAQIQRELGGSVQQATASAGAEFARFWNAMRDLGGVLGSVLVPGLAAVASALTTIIEKILGTGQAALKAKKDIAAALAQDVREGATATELREVETRQKIVNDLIEKRNAAEQEGRAGLAEQYDLQLVKQRAMLADSLNNIKEQSAARARAKEPTEVDEEAFVAAEAKKWQERKGAIKKDLQDLQKEQVRLGKVGAITGDQEGTISDQLQDARKRREEIAKRIVDQGINVEALPESTRTELTKANELVKNLEAKQKDLRNADKTARAEAKEHYQTERAQLTGLLADNREKLQLAQMESDVAIETVRQQHDEVALAQVQGSEAAKNLALARASLDTEITKAQVVLAATTKPHERAQAEEELKKLTTQRGQVEMQQRLNDLQSPYAVHQAEIRREQERLSASAAITQTEMQGQMQMAQASSQHAITLLEQQNALTMHQMELRGASDDDLQQTRYQQQVDLAQRRYDIELQTYTLKQNMLQVEMNILAEQFKQTNTEGEKLRIVGQMAQKAVEQNTLTANAPIKDQIIQPMTNAQREMARFPQNMAQSLSQGIGDLMQAFQDGGANLAKSIQNMGQRITDIALKPLFAQMEGNMQKLFESFGQWGPMIGAGIGIALSAIGALLNKQKAEVQSLGGDVKKNIESVEKTRGLVAGEQNIAVQQLSQNLGMAMRPGNEILLRIEAVLRMIAAAETGQPLPEGAGGYAVTNQLYASELLGSARLS